MRSSTLPTRAAVALAVVLAIAALGGAAAAQENATATADDPESYEIAIDQHTRVVDSEWDGRELTLVVEADVTREIVVTDASQRLQGAVDIKRERVTVPSGERTEVTFVVANGEQPGVTVATLNGIVGLGDQPDSLDPDPVPFSGAAIAVGIASVGTGAGTFLMVRKRRETDEKAVERVA